MVVNDPPPTETKPAPPIADTSLTALPDESFAVIVIVAISPRAYEALSSETV